MWYIHTLEAEECLAVSKSGATGTTNGKKRSLLFGSWFLLCVFWVSFILAKLLCYLNTRSLYDCIMIKEIALMMIKTNCNCLLPTDLTWFHSASFCTRCFLTFLFTLSHTEQVDCAISQCAGVRFFTVWLYTTLCLLS